MARIEWMKGPVRALEKVGWRQGSGTEAQRNTLGTRPGATEVALEKRWQIQESGRNEQD